MDVHPKETCVKNSSLGHMSVLEYCVFFTCFLPLSHIQWAPLAI